MMTSTTTPKTRNDRKYSPSLDTKLTVLPQEDSETIRLLTEQAQRLSCGSSRRDSRSSYLIMRLIVADRSTCSAVCNISASCNWMKSSRIRILLPAYYLHGDGCPLWLQVYDAKLYETFDEAYKRVPISQVEVVPCRSRRRLPEHTSFLLCNAGGA